MAIVEYGANITALKGSIGGFSFHVNRSGNIVRLKGATRKQVNNLQTEKQLLHSKYLQLWQNLTPSQRLAWNTFGDTYTKVNKFGDIRTLTGLNWFESVNQNRELFALSILNDPPTHELPTAITNFELEATSANLKVKNFVPSVAANTGIKIYVMKPTTRLTNSIRPLLKLAKVNSSIPTVPLDIKADYENATFVSYPPSTVDLCMRVNVGITTVHLLSGIESTFIYKGATLSTPFTGIGYMIIETDFIVG